MTSSPCAPHSTSLPPLSPTARTTPTRGRIRQVVERERLHEVLREALVAHLGFVRDAGTGDASTVRPVVLPVAIAVDPEGPDEGGTLYVHGSVAAGWAESVIGQEVCVSVTLLDGLVAARSGFHHSMNYRSAVVLGTARRVDDEEERLRALAAVVDHMVPGRSATLRPVSRKELAATLVLAVPLAEASLKVRAGGPVDDEADVASGVWGGHVPIRLVAGEAVPAADADGPVPDDVAARIAALR
ncbi:pyridoxamine 5'-phosphate oxidase family protein [Nocardioides acrostichi]|uniref:Pyridoxamine 5'-phosphate oxidase family protein n=1 Tax=Nocardioides acrostichi TaxID=2784339 RepID=A0A930UWF5_9ACTN|nr:pyridoxamine 5'-phosphate oxidase family protein [Nocardioides acrostichi]MBF4160315.1 pyridoxamine 5'-phosphate oxidase family protein [Nocardioides acrostichi]